MQNDAGKRHERSNDYEKDHKDRGPVRDAPPLVESLHCVHGQGDANPNEYESGHSEGEQGLLKLDIAQDPDEHLQTVR